MNEKRHNIGLLIANIMDPFSNGIAKGAMLAAEKNDCNLFIVPGKYIDLDINLNEYDAKYEYQYNALFSFVSEHNLDYLIVCIGTIAYMSDLKRKKEFLSMFDGTPILSVAAKIDGYDYIQYENRPGIVQAVNYLAKQMDKKHICMMVGDLNNNECVERFEAYQDGLKSNGLKYSSDMIIESDISSNCYNEVRLLLDRNPDCDAIMCVNDDIALTVYAILRERNIRIGKDVSVVGFDNLPYAEKLDPPLASIRAEANKLGIMSIEKAVNFLDGVDDDRHLLPTTFIPRQSCFGSSVKAITSDSVFYGKSENIANNIINYIYENSINALTYTTFEQALEKLLSMLDTIFVKNKANDFEIDKLNEKINQFFTNNGYVINSISKMIEVIDSGYAIFRERISDYNKPYLQKTYDYLIRRITLELISNYKTIEDKNYDRRHLSNLAIRDTLMFDGDIKNYYSQILKKLHYIGVDTSYLYVFKEPVVYHNRDKFPTDVDWYFKAYQYGEATYNVPAEEQKLSTSQIFSVEQLPYDRRFTVILVDLYSNEKQYGLAICEPRSDEYLEYIELITYQLSAAVKMIELLNQQEKMLTELHTNNLALETMSKIDELTGVYNRRGFYYVANELLSKPNNHDKKLVVCYADMDNLKYVNDSFGHIEGDFSIKALANCLEEMFLDFGIVGRVGGDEFAVCAMRDKVGSLEEIQKRKDDIIKTLNEKSDKPYHIDMSIGLYECVCDNSYDFKDAIDKADDLLYSAKKKRKKLVSEKRI